MKNARLILLELAVLFISSLFLIINSVHLQAIQSPPSPFISPTIPLQPSSPPQPAIPPGPESSPPQPAIPPGPESPPPQPAIPSPPLQPSSPPQPAIPQQEPVAGLTASGTINSLIYAPQTKWIATGNWSMDVNNGNVTSFITNMLWYNDNGTATHTHEIQNFKSTEGKIVTVQPDNSLFLKGLVDVGTNHRMVWKNVHSTIDIKGGKTIVISLDHEETKNHFARQSIYGVVTSLTPCSDEPGPNMEVLPSCRLPSDTGFFNSSTQP
jgi:hypothetical protein